MSRAITTASPNQSGLINTLLEKFKLKNDAALARKLSVAPPVISKIRSGALPLGATMLVKIHETFGMSIADIRKAAGQ